MPSFEVAQDGSLAEVVDAVCAGLGPGDVVLLRGPIGAGKTALVRACAARLGIVEPVTSPTFALAHRYGGAPPIAHLDLYRLEAQPLRDTGDLAAELAGDAIGFVEWPELGATWLPPAALAVEIAVDADGTRRFTLTRPTIPPCAS